MLHLLCCDVLSNLSNHTRMPASAMLSNTNRLNAHQHACFQGTPVLAAGKSSNRIASDAQSIASTGTPTFQMDSSRCKHDTQWSCNSSQHSVMLNAGDEAGL